MGRNFFLDDYQYTQSRYIGDRNPSASEYNHRTLVEGNVCTYNGGSCIQVFLAVNVTVKNNTCVGNRQYSFTGNRSDINFGQVSLLHSFGCHVANNVLVSKPVGAAPNGSPYAASNMGSGASTNFWVRNLLYSSGNGNWSFLGRGPNIAYQSYRRDPRFADEANFDFRSIEGFNKGTRWGGLFYYDINGTEVAPNTRNDLDAYQN